MTPPLISVVITTYNYGRFIEECVDSVLSQDYPAGRREVIVVDDGSTDDTAERVKKYGSAICYLRQPNGGQASALNAGFAQARGEIISLLDADDYFLPGKLARVAEAFQQDPSLGMFYHPFLEFDMATGERRTSTFPPVISGSPYKEPAKFANWVGPGTCVSFRRKFLERMLPIPEEIRMCGEYYIASLIILLAPVAAVPECLSAYRFHGSNAFHVEQSQMSTEARRKRVGQLDVAHRAIRRWLAENGYTRRDLPVRIFLDRLSLHQAWEEFQLEPPGRLDFLRAVFLENRAQSHFSQNWKLTAFNYLTTPAALVFGFQRREQMYEWRGRAMAALQSLIGSASSVAPSK